MELLVNDPLSLVSDRDRFLRWWFKFYNFPLFLTSCIKATAWPIFLISMFVLCTMLLKIYEEHLMTKWKCVYQNLQMHAINSLRESRCGTKTSFHLQETPCGSILLSNYLAQVFTVWVITYQGRDLTVLGPVQTPKRITIEVGLFYKWASYLLVSKYSLQMEFWRIEFFYPW